MEDVYSDRSACASFNLVDELLSSSSVVLINAAFLSAVKSKYPLFAMTKVLVLSVISIM